MRDGREAGTGEGGEGMPRKQRSWDAQDGGEGMALPRSSLDGEGAHFFGS